MNLLTSSSRLLSTLILCRLHLILTKNLTSLTNKLCTTFNLQCSLLPKYYHDVSSVWFKCIVCDTHKLSAGLTGVTTPAQESSFLVSKIWCRAVFGASCWYKILEHLSPLLPYFIYGKDYWQLYLVLCLLFNSVGSKSPAQIKSACILTRLFWSGELNSSLLLAQYISHNYWLWKTVDYYQFPAVIYDCMF